MNACPRCGRRVQLTSRGVVRAHSAGPTAYCPGSGQPPAAFGPAVTPDPPREMMRLIPFTQAQVNARKKEQRRRGARKTPQPVYRVMRCPKCGAQTRATDG